MSFQLVGNIRGPAGPPGGGGEYIWVGPEPPSPRGDYVLWVREGVTGQPQIPVAPEITLVRAAGGVGATLPLPTHEAGDMIIFAARRAATAVATMPPGWNTIFAATANTLALSTAWRIADDGNTESGTWTNADHVACIILRGNATLSAGPSATNNANNATNVAYPALTGVLANQASMGVRIAARGAAATNQIAAPPAVGGAAAWTNRINQPPTGGGLLAIHTLDNLTANIAAQTVTQTGSAPFRAHTFEVRIATPDPIPPVAPVVPALFRWDRERWTEVGRPAVGTTAPPDPEIGDMWIDTSP